jgi:hypothetical protein
VVLGASVLCLTPLAQADEPTSRPAAVEGSTSRQATERWQRLKSQYQAAPEKTSAINPASNAVSAEKSPAEPTRIAATTAATPVTNNRELPDWTLPGPDDDKGLTVEEILSRPEEDPPTKPQEPVPYEEKDEVKTPDLRTGTPRPLPGQLRGGPTRKTTQVRRIGEIAPLNDFDKDTEIKRYAAEKAREFNVKFGGEAYTPRNFPDVAMTWEAPTTKYYPLYFQDPALERYGHTHHPLVQPVISSARMSGQLVMMPYQMAIVPPWQLESPLGWYRPGDVVPKLRYPFPWNTKAALIEAAAVTGFIYVIP